MEACSPTLVEGHSTPTYACAPEDRDPWSMAMEVEVGPQDPEPDLRETVQILQGVLRAHDEAHEQPRPRPVRNATPKFKGGLGMQGQKITEVGPSATGTG